MIRLRPFQQEIKGAINEQWAQGAKNIMAVLPTGGGKTVLFGNIMAENPGASVAIAHRQELTAQISLALARNGIRHRVIGQKAAQREIVRLHIDEVGRDFTHQHADVGVAGINTLLNHDKNDTWLKQVSLVVQDEGHHVLAANQWGRAMQLFPNARGLFPTATPRRADRKGLGRHADGLTDALVVGPAMRDLINMGYLTDYRIYAPPCDIDRNTLKVSESTGEFDKVQLRNVFHESKTIVGDVVKHYLRIAPGKLGVTFAVDIEEATKIAAAFRAAGVPAEVVTGETPTIMRQHILRRFRNREVLQLVNVDLFGEGFDLPAIEVVSMARPTMSFALYAQQFGRVLRLMLPAALAGAWDTYSDAQRLQHIAQCGKPYGIIIDHVSNVAEHGLPDAPREWSLNRGERRTRGKPSDAIPTRTCMNELCMGVYERVYKLCPYCGHEVEPPARREPDAVDGDLFELDPEICKALRGEMARIDSPAYTKHLVGHAAQALKIRHSERQQAQYKLRDTITLWAGRQRDLGRPDSEIYRRFYFMFGCDILTAQTYSTADATSLAARVQQSLDKEGVIRA
jgi:DNA repair protein RadD